MKRINILDEHTSNKIAAGEVVERPASVVKELVENSIDAGAKNITIEIEEGGINLIRVIDNGSGIYADDISKAFLPHATSKIVSVDDIYHINTLGFRGEALPSIASVSEVNFRSKTADANFGKEVSISAGEILSINDIGMNNGSIMEVRNLFFNVPARKKFLKTPSREGSLANDIVTRIALSYPNISFKLFNNKKKTLLTYGDNNLASTIRTIYGKTIYEDIIEFSECRQFIDTPVKRYSSGMFVKLAFSVAAHLDSEILIMDEVLAVGDMKFQKKCIDKMIEISKSGRTILYVSHNMDTIRRLCSRAVVLDKGTIRYEGDVDTAINIYLDNKSSKPMLKNDLSKKERQSYLPKEDRARFEYLEIIDRDDTTFVDNEIFKCRVRWKNFENIKDVQLRFEIRTYDDVPVATSVSSSTLSFSKNTYTEYDVELDISRLVSGKYQLLVVLSEMGASNNYIDIDGVYPACVFEVNRDKFNEYKFKWNNKQWGYIQLPDIELKELQCI